MEQEAILPTLEAAQAPLGCGRRSPLLAAEYLARRLRPPPFAANLLLLCGSLLFILVSAEICVRLLHKQLNRAVLWSDRPAYYYAPAAGAVHDFNYLLPKPDGVFRVAAVGDSFTFAPLLQFDDAYPKRLERMLNLGAYGGAQTRAEVINYGRWGASSLSEVVKVERALAEGADLVLLEITLNDPQVFDYDPKTTALKGKYTFGELKIKPGSVLDRWKTAGLIASSLHRIAALKSTVRYHRELFDNPETWDLFAKSLTEMSLLCKAANRPFAAFIFPFVQYSNGEDYPFLSAHEKISALLVDLGVPHLDLLSAFAGIPPERLIVQPGKDLHPNEIAHRIAAERVYSWLEREHLLASEVMIAKKYKTRTKRVRAGDPRP